MTANFLGTTRDIRKRLLDRLSGIDSIDLAVAFITNEWLELFGDFKGKSRVICWLSSTNTNPYAVEHMLQTKKGFRVKHYHGMHAKVYLSTGENGFAIVGSANLSSAALSLKDSNSIGGNIEAGIEINDTRNLAETARWFNELWKRAQKVTHKDLAKAKAAYKARAKAMKAVGGKTSRLIIDPAWEPSTQMEALAFEARSISVGELRKSSGWQFLHEVDPEELTKHDLTQVVDRLAEWAKRRWSFARVLQEPIGKVRAAFSVALDKSRPINTRLQLLQTEHKLSGLGLPAWSMILFGWSPPDYPPLNNRTAKFIRDMKIGTNIPKTPSPTSYDQWCDLCRELAVRLRLPSAGHIDRMVWAHTGDMTYQELGE